MALVNLTKTSIINVLCMISVMGCSEQETEMDTPRREKFLLIGLIPEHRIFKQIERYEPFACYLSEKLGIEIKLRVLTRYGNIVDNFVSSGLDAAFFGSFTYTLAHERIGVEVIARPENTEGISTYHGLIFVRNDSGIKGPKNMKGKRFAFVDKATTAGYLLPLAYFKTHGIEDYKTFLKETYYTGTHEDAIYDVLEKKADIGAAKNTVFIRLAADDNRIMDKLLVLERSPDVPENGLAVRKDLDKPVRDKLEQILQNMDKDPNGMDVLKTFGAQKFIKTTNNDYVNVYNYTQKIGLDLKKYDYVND